MKKILVVLAVLVTSSTVLSAECTKEQRIKLVMKGVDDATIDKVCAQVGNKKTKVKIAGEVDRERIYASLTASFYKTSVKQILDNFGLDDNPSSALAAKIAVGYVFDNNDRIEIAFLNYSSEYTPLYYQPITIDTTNLILNYIHTFGEKEIALKSFTPFVSVGYSQGSYGSDVTDLHSGGSGFHFGAGAIYSLDNNVEFDISYDIGIMSWVDEDNNSNLLMSSDYHGISFAARYKF